MQFGVSIWLWTSPVTTETIEKYSSKVAEMGFDGIEIPIEEPDAIDAKKVRETLVSHNLSVTTCAAMGPGRDLIIPDESVQQQTIDYLKECIDISAELGSTVFVGPLYSEIGRLWKADSKQKAEEKKLLVNHLKALSNYAEQNNMTICVEALNRFETSFLNLTSQVAEIVDQVNSDHCKILIDLFHAGIEEKSLGQAIRQAGDRLGHLQVAENDRGTPGTGQFDWQEIASTLSEIGYDGSVVIETFSPNNEMLAKAAAIWRPLANSPDELAKNGLNVLKKLLAE